MDVVRTVLANFFGIIGVLLLIISLLSLFFNGSTLAWVSDKANKSHHFYMAASVISIGVCFAIYFPEHDLGIIFCFFPVILLVIIFSYFTSSSTRRNIDSFFSKSEIKNPFKNKK